MAFGSQLAVDFEDGENVNTRIIREKVSSLKSTFMSRHFTEVEEFLVSMEENLELEIKSLKKEKELIEERAQIQRLEKLKVEGELRECTRECLQLKKERDGSNETVKSISEVERIMRELKEENRDLKGEKLKAETETDFYKRKFEDLKMMLLLLKKDVILKPEEPISNVGVPGEVVGAKGVVDENLKRDENAVNLKTKMFATACNDNVVIEANGVPSCYTPRGIVDLGARGLRCDGGSGEGLGKNGLIENEKGGEGSGNLKAKMGFVDSHGNMVLGANGGSSSNLLENGDGIVGGASGGGKPPLKEIIELVDSDDDTSSCAISSRNELAMEGCQYEADLDQGVVENETKLLKRKRASSSTSKDSHGSSNEQKATKRKGLIEGLDSLPVNHRLATTMFSESNEGRNVSTPSRQGQTILTQLEEKITAECYSRNQRNELVLDRLLLDSDSEDSSSSSDSEDLDFSFDFSAMTKLFASKEKQELNGSRHVES
ncbi:hypothetical protein H0E87_012102 [Populus deltoides]|uniref:Uncharacterized protein n=1 Tax=Populus deltoides TaxID=3696 RepID=A0A8T2YI66_POPDE|nr:hypothetical protein H0E87_012102 [Populus deltoides]